MLPALLAASIAVGTFAANTFAVGSDDRYDKTYTIGNILSDFQYFTKGDLKGSGHTVGAAAVGGTMDKGNSFGNGAVTPSFINKIDQAAAAFGVYKFEGSNDVLYYVDGVEKMQNWGSSLKTVKSDGKYIDFDAAFTAVEKQSEALAAAGKTLSAADINDEGSEAHFYAYNELGYETEKPDDSSSADSSAADSSADSSKADSSSAADFSSSADNSSTSDTSSSDSSSNSDSSQPDKPDVKTTSVEFQKITDKNIALEGAVFGLYKDGICSVPVQKDGASYTFQSGADGIVRFEGLEAGTYYFKELQAPAGYEVNNKTYENADLADLTTAQRDELAQATEFTLYADAELSDVIAAASPIVTNGKFSVSFNDGLSVPTEAGAFNIYYMAESNAPNDYKVSDSVYVCRIDNSGAVAYKLLGQSDAAYSAAIPECENKLDKTTEDSGAVDNSSAADTSSSSDSRDMLESTSDNSSSADSSSVGDVTDSDAEQDSSSDTDSSDSSASSAADSENNSGADSSASSAATSSTGTGNSTSSNAAGSSSSSANGSGSSNNSTGNPNTGVKSTLGVSAVLIAAAAVCVRKNKNR